MGRITDNRNESLEIISRLNVTADSQEALFDLLSDQLLKEDYVYPTYREAIKNRESEFPTGLITTSVGVAIPHTDPVHVKKNAIVIVTLANPIRFHEMGGGEGDFVNVECVFAILLNNSDKQMKLLMDFMNIFRNREDMYCLRNVQSTEEAARILRRYIS